MSNTVSLKTAAHYAVSIASAHALQGVRADHVGGRCVVLHSLPERLAGRDGEADVVGGVLG